MTARSRRGALLVAVAAVLVATVGTITLSAARTAADATTTTTTTVPTYTDTLTGEGGSFLAPVTNLLLNDDTGLGVYPAYNDANIDTGIADFVGTGPGTFNADFAVSERPLTAAESRQAAADGRSFAYVPFAATPVAIATLVLCTPSDLLSGVVNDATFCNHIPLTPALIGDIFTTNYTSLTGSPNQGLSTRLNGWDVSPLTQAGGATIPDDDGIGQASILGPSAENSAVMALMDSDPTARVDLDNALNNPANYASTTSDTPSEIWPFHGLHAYPGGDDGMISHELSIGAETNAPSALSSWGGLADVHDAFPVSNAWTGAPLGTPWNIPTAAVENASDAFVAPSAASAAAAEADASLDPTTNLVTFNASPTDAAAYNNYLMVESYLVVPLTSLPADRAVALAQFIRYVLGATGQADIKLFGAAPATPAMVSAGLAVAAKLDAEGDTAAPVTTATTPPSTSTSATTPPSTTGSTSATTTTTTIAGATKASKKAKKQTSKKSTLPTSSSSHPRGTTATPVVAAASGSRSSDLALTGFDPLPLLFVGIALAVGSEIGRRRLRRRLAAVRNSRGHFR